MWLESLSEQPPWFHRLSFYYGLIMDRNFYNLEYYKKKMSRYKIGPHENEKTLIKMAQNGNEKAKTKLLGQYYPFIISQAVKHYKTIKNRNVDINDLIIVANEGYLEGIQKYDLKRNYKLYSYARHYARRNMTNELLNTVYCMKIPAKMGWPNYTHNDKPLKYIISEEQNYEDNVKELVLKVLCEICSDIEQEIFKRKNGIDCQKESCRQIAKTMNTYHEKISKIYNKACAKLKKHKIIKELKEYL